MCSPPREVTPDEADTLGKSFLPLIDSLIFSGLTPSNALRLLRSALDHATRCYDLGDSAIAVYHAPDCPVARAGFVASIEGPSQCRCDFMQRLQVALDHGFCA